MNLKKNWSIWKTLNGGNKPFYLLEWKQIGRILLGSLDWHEYSGQNRALQCSQLCTCWDGQKPITGRYLGISVSGSGFESVPPLHSKQLGACVSIFVLSGQPNRPRPGICTPQPEPQYCISDHRAWGLRFLQIGVGHGAKAHVIISWKVQWGLGLVPDAYYSGDFRQQLPKEVFTSLWLVTASPFTLCTDLDVYQDFHRAHNSYPSGSSGN
jgi:hypothetical protein